MLQEAVIKGDLELVQKILHGDNEIIKLKFGWCICLAAREKHRDIVKLLLEHGWDVNQEDAEGQTPISYSVRQNDVKTTKVLLKNGAKINGRLEHYQTIFLAATKGFADIVQVLVDFGADVNAKDEIGQTPLHYAILQDFFTELTTLQESSSVKIRAIEKIVRALLGNGSDVNAKTVNGFSPLHYAVKLKYATIVRALLEYGADFHSPVHSDIGTEIATLRILLPMKPSLTTIVHIAAESDDVQSLTALLNAGATVDSVQYDGKTPLIVGIERQLDSVVTLLLEYGADIEQRSKDGLTPLHVACRKGSVKVLNSLLEAGADINAVCNNGMVPYQYILQEERIRNAFISGRYFLTEHLKRNKTIIEYYSYDFTTNRINMTKTLQNHVIMMNVNGIYLHDFNKEIAMKTPSTLDTNFKKEIEEFSKSVTVCNCVNLYHIINNIRNPFYIRNPNVLKGLDQAVVVTNAKYPGFGSILKYLVRRAQVRVDLINTGVEWFKVLNGKNNELPPLPVEILNIVLSFLLDEDIKNFINCVEVLCYCTEATGLQFRFT